MTDTEDHRATCLEDNQTERILLLGGGMNDGNVSAAFSEDKLKLKGDFYPPSHGGRPLMI